MKRYLKSLLLMAVVACVTACSLDKLPAEVDGPDVEKVGYLQISGVAVSADTEIAIIGGKKASATRATEEAADSYFIEVWPKNPVEGEAAAWSGNYSDLKQGEQAKVIGLEPGTYVVYAYQTSAKAPAQGAAADAPYYVGHSEDVVINHRTHTQENPATTSVTCRMSNIKTTVELSADLKTVFKTYEAAEDNSLDEKRLKTVVEVGREAENGAIEGNAYTFESDATHSSPLVYFADVTGASNTMVITLSGTYYTGDPVDILENRADESLWKENVKMVKKITGVRAAQWRKVSIDIDHNTTGDAQFKFTIDGYTYDETITVDVVTLYAALNFEETIPDDDENNPAAPLVTIDGRDDLTYAINSSLYDADGEFWSSVLKLKVAAQDNTSVSEVYATLIENEDGSISNSLLSAIASNGFEEGIIPLYPAATATSPYVNAAADGSLITLKQAGMDALYKYNGTHTFRVYTVDSDGRRGFADVVITVTADAGQGPSIVWMSNGVPSNATTIESTDATAKAIVTSQAEEGVIGLRVNIISPLLDAEELGKYGLAQEMDVLEPASAVMETRLRAFGFLPIENFDPAGKSDAEVSAAAELADNYRIYDPATGERIEGRVSPLKNKMALDFEISKFLPLLKMLGTGVDENTGEERESVTHTFILQATDKDGTSSSTFVITVNK